MAYDDITAIGQECRTRPRVDMALSPAETHELARALKSDRHLSVDTAPFQGRSITFIAQQ